MNITYVNKNFTASTLSIIDAANIIIEDYEAAGLWLTLRQLYYQFVARGLIDNKQKEYDKLGRIISNARLAGLISWESIEDRTRNLVENSHWLNPGDIIASAAQSYRMDLWADQDFRVEVWIEKDALSGVIAGVCNALDVPYFACKGYVSQSEMWQAARRVEDCSFNNQYMVIIHLGDHDPSGIDMTRDIADRLKVFGVDCKVERIALNMNQIQEFRPPPNPTKVTDSRADQYITKYGHDSWELDAFEPADMQRLVREQIESYRDNDKYFKRIEIQEEHRKTLKAFSSNWKK